MTKKIRIAVAGAGGRVGQELQKLIKQDQSLEAAIGVGKRAEGFAVCGSSFSYLQGATADILIDFSSPDLFTEALEYCLQNRIPIVSGTTGLEKHHYEKMVEAGKSIPVLWAPNMSLGIAVLKKALQVFKSTTDFDFQVEEWHHRHKKDRPSGTALLLQQELEQVIGRTCPETLVMRAGGIFGVHKVYAASDEEIIEFSHTALNRTVFARGALFASRWLINQQNGCYSMDDVIS